MIVTPFDFSLDPLVGRGTRTPGIHCTAIIERLERAIKGDKDPDHWDYAGAVGFLWEDAMSRAFRDQAVVCSDLTKDPQLYHIGELEHDAILLTPDTVAMTYDEVWDFKFTWKGLKKTPPEAVWKYMVQIKAYAYVMGLHKARLVCMYANGDYSPMRPMPVGRHFVFTDRELEENWTMLRNGAAVLRDEAAAGDTPGSVRESGGGERTLWRS